MNDELFDATSFYEKEIDDFVQRQNTRRAIKLWADNRKEIELCRKRALGYAQRYDVVIETEMLSENILELRYTGNLYDG